MLLQHLRDTLHRRMTTLLKASDLRGLTYEERFEKLRQCGTVGEETFGYKRYLNQNFYRSSRWKSVRDKVIIRDGACDMGHPDHPIDGRVIVHHINALTIKDIEEESGALTDMENLICVSHMTHEAITYGDSSLLPKDFVERKPNDTCPWKGV